MSHERVDEQEAAGHQVRVAIAAILRWASRGEVRRALSGSGNGLSPTDTWLLGAIVEQGPMRATDLAQWQAVDKSTITPQLRRLEERGLVTRRPDPADRRAVLITTTPCGQAALERISNAGVAVFNDILRTWPSPDRDALAALLTRLTEQLPEPPARRRQKGPEIP